MSTLFTSILNMSITGSYVIAAIMLIRLFIIKAPKRFSYMLWSVVGFRLAVPVSFKSVFSLFSIKPFDMTRAQSTSQAALTYVPELQPQTTPEITTGMPALNTVVDTAVADVSVTKSSLDVVTIISFIWFAVFAVMIIYSIASYIMLKRKMSNAVRYEGNVYQSDKISSPFILGIIKPKIYIPFGISSDSLEYIIAHERYHIKRFDFVVKMIAFLLLAVHWFNPLCWIAFYFMTRDMEMSCDEWVLYHNDGIKKIYSSTLLSFAVDKKFPSPSRLCFGESSVKSRIKNVLKFRRPKLVISLVVFTVCLAVIVGCAANPNGKENISHSAISATETVSDIENMNIGAEMPQLLYADNEKIVFTGTCGIVTYDYSKNEIVDRLTADEIEKLGIGAHYSKSVSLDGKKVYLINNEFDDGEERKGYIYNIESSKLTEMKDIKTDKLFKPEYIDDFNNIDFFGNYYLFGSYGATVGDKFLYLRANTDRSMKSLVLVICNLPSQEVTSTIGIFNSSSDNYYGLGDVIGINGFLSRIIYNGRPARIEITDSAIRVIQNDVWIVAKKYSEERVNAKDVELYGYIMLNDEGKRLFESKRNVTRCVYYNEKSDKEIDDLHNDGVVYFSDGVPFAYADFNGLYRLEPTDLEVRLDKIIEENEKKQYYSNGTDDNFAQCHKLLYVRDGDINGDNIDSYATAYAYVSAVNLSMENGILVENSGGAHPVAVEFKKSGNAYEPVEYYTIIKDFKSEFPDEVYKRYEYLIDMEGVGDDLFTGLSFMAYDKIITENELAVQPIIKTAFSRLGKLSENESRDKVVDTPEYRCLIGCGKYTLDYIFNEVKNKKLNDETLRQYRIMTQRLIPKYEQLEIKNADDKEYFERYVKHYSDILRINDLEDFKNDYPYGYLIISA